MLYLLCYVSGLQNRNFAAAAASQVHTKCKLVNGVYVITLDSPNVKVSVRKYNIVTKNFQNS